MLHHRHCAARRNVQWGIDLLCVNVAGVVASVHVDEMVCGTDSEASISHLTVATARARIVQLFTAARIHISQSRRTYIHCRPLLLSLQLYNSSHTDLCAHCTVGCTGVSKFSLPSLPSSFHSTFLALPTRHTCLCYCVTSYQPSIRLWIDSLEQSV